MSSVVQEFKYPKKTLVFRAEHSENHIAAGITRLIPHGHLKKSMTIRRRMLELDELYHESLVLILAHWDLFHES